MPEPVSASTASHAIDHERFKNIAAGVQSFAAAIALAIAGLWVVFSLLCIEVRTEGESGNSVSRVRRAARACAANRNVRIRAIGARVWSAESNNSRETSKRREAGIRV